MKKNRTDRASLRAAGLAVIEPIERRLLMSTYTVNTLSDAVTPVAGQLTLRQAVADANAHAGADTISFDPKVFAAGTLHTINLTQGQIVFTDYNGATTVNGPGAAVLAVNAGGHSRVFKISSGVSVAISNMTITGGTFFSPAGLLAAGGDVLDNGKLALSGVTVENGTAFGGAEPGETDIDGGPAQGGGIYSNGTLSLVNSIVSNNNVTGGDTNGFKASGGSARGAGIFSSGSLSVTSSTISGNTADGGLSGGYGFGGEANGGGIFNYGPISITSSSIINNSANGGGEGTLFGPDTGGGAASGGGVYTTHSLTLSSDFVDGNAANGGGSGADGGMAGQGYGGGIISTASLVISNSSLVGNRANGGEGPYDDNGPGALGYGGAIVAEGSLSLANSTVSDNSATGGYGNPEGTPSAGALGGGIDAQKSLTITSSTISDNSATGGAGGIYGGIGGSADGGGIFGGESATITGSSVIGNIALGGAGGTSDGTYLSNLGGDAEGAGLFDSGGLTLINSTIANNRATGGTGGKGEYNGGGSPAGDGANGGNGVGSAIYADTALTVEDSTISGNTTAGGAGGIAYNGYPAGSPGTGEAAVTLVGSNATFNNTIVSANIANTSTDDDISGTLASTSSNNLIGTGGGLTNGVHGNKVGVTNPQLMPLGWYGGPTETMLPIAGSPAINAGSNSLIPSGVTTDQRGDARVVGSSVDIGSVEFGSTVITGTVFNDENADGKRESNEPGVGGFTVYLDLNHDGKFDTGDYSTTTNSSGDYTFDGLPAGSYTVSVIGMTNYRATTATSYSVSAVSNTTTVSAFGQTQDALISGSVVNATTHAAPSGFRVYLDLNDDGKYESNEPSVVTSSNGSWSFNIAAPGTYEIRIVPMAKYKTTAPSSGFFTFTVGKASARIGNVFAELPIS